MDSSSSGNVSVGSKTSVVLAPKWLGKRVGRFKLLALLGQGAMGRVFRAEDTLMQRHVALKLLPRTVKRGPNNNVGAEMLIREARAAAAIEHPGAVQIYEINEAGDTYYIAMELLEGGSLRDLVKAAGPLDPTRACLLAAEAAEALAHAHSIGVVHRDVKPANLMLNRSGRCKVVDFGLARVDDPSDLSSFLAESVGTPQFIAPEILTGTPASPQSDIYSLGGTVWYLLTGHPPFEAGTAQDLLQMHVHSPLPDLRSIRPDVPQGLADALSTALSKRPHDRYTSMAQFAKVLRVHTIPIAGSATDLGLPEPLTPPPPPGGSSQIALARPERFPFPPQRPSTPFEALPAARIIEEPEALAPPAPKPKPFWTTWPFIGGAALIGTIALVIACIVLLRPGNSDVASNTTPAAPPVSVNSAPKPQPSVAPVVAPAAPVAPPMLTAQWVADDYQPGNNWVDRVQHIIAQQKGSPGLARHAFAGHNGIALNGSNQCFVLRAADYPLPDGKSMAVAVVFRAKTAGKAGPQFWSGAGLVGADLKDTVDDWGIGWGGLRGTQVLAGVGNFPPKTDGTIASPKLDIDHTYVALFTWQFNGAQNGIGTITLYIDGEQVSTEWKTTEPRTLDDPIALGAANGSGINPFHGEIAEIRFYRDANVNAAQICKELLKTYSTDTPFGTSIFSHH